MKTDKVVVWVFVSLFVVVITFGIINSGARGNKEKAKKITVLYTEAKLLDEKKNYEALKIKIKDIYKVEYTGKELVDVLKDIKRMEVDIAKYDAVMMEKKKKELEEMKRLLPKKLAALRKKVDKVENIEFYDDYSSPYYLNSNGFFVYMGKNGNAVWLRLKIQYASDDWLFIKSVIVNVDGDVDTLIEKDFERDHDSRIWEWIDVSAIDYLPRLKQIANSKTTYVKLVGGQYQHSYELSYQQKRAMKNMIEIFEFIRDTY